jgi:hypothetical protein
MTIGQDLLNAPFPEMVKNLGLGIAEAQQALDQVSIRIAQQMAGFKLDSNGTLVRDDTALIKLREDAPPVSLLSLGFAPTFYQFVDTVIEIKMSMSMSKSVEVGLKVKVRTFTASVNASFAAKYQYSAEGSSLMRTKLVTVPAPAMFEQRIREELAIVVEEQQQQ